MFFRFLDKAAIVLPPSDETCNKPMSSWSLCTVTQVEELKILLRMFPTWASFVIFFAVNGQMSSTFIEQGMAMDNHVGSFAIPPASLTIIAVLSVLVLVPERQLQFGWAPRLGIPPNSLHPEARRRGGREEAATHESPPRCRRELVVVNSRYGYGVAKLVSGAPVARSDIPSFLPCQISVLPWLARSGIYSRSDRGRQVVASGCQGRCWQQ